MELYCICLRPIEINIRILQINYIIHLGELQLISYGNYVTRLNRYCFLY